MNGTAEPDQMLPPEAVVNLDLYPIEDPIGRRYRDLVARLREELNAQQYVVLPQFMTPAAIEISVAQAKQARPLANDNNNRRNCYLTRTTDSTLPEDHPQNLLYDTSNRLIAYDLLPSDCPLKTFYHWAPARRFVSEIVGEDELYDNEDPYQPVNAVCYEDGDRSSWHFDSVNAFTMTLMLQAPDSGGDFEIVPNTRSETDQNIDLVRSILQGDESRAIRVGREPGALCIFRGCNSLHRVTEVKGERMRIMGVFVYETEPGVVGDPEVNANIFGPRVVVAK